MVFSRAGRAEILRAAQKDDEFCDEFKLTLSDFLAEVVGQRLWLTRYNVIGHFSRLVYQTCTTLRNIQTLGEEYTGIIQVDGTLKHLPTKSVFLCSTLLDSGGELFFRWVVYKCEKYLRENNMESKRKDQIQKLLIFAKVILPFLQHLHKTLFYLTGEYYSFSKRCMGIRYILYRAWLKDKESGQTFHWLGIVSAVYLLLTTVHNLRSHYVWNKQLITLSSSVAKGSQSINPTLKCSLCLETRKDTSCTPCGHLFCWSCIHEWLLSKNECPLCRDNVQPSRIVRLQNYDVSNSSVPNSL